jgi:RNA polymerase sigma factor (sigma-70 family)
MFHQQDPTYDQRAGLSLVARRAAVGDERAWNELVGRFDQLLRGVVRRYRLSAADVDDTVQTTWLRAVDHLGRLNDPGAIAGWLMVTARREAMRTLQRAVREVVVGELDPFDEPDVATPESLAIEHERDAAVRGAVGRLCGRQGRLMRSMLANPWQTYEELSATLDMPVGSIGPTRDRALAQLRCDPELTRAIGT